MIAFEKKEKSPKVTRFNGKEIKLKSGLRTLNIIDKINTPIIKVEMPS